MRRRVHRLQFVLNYLQRELKTEDCGLKTFILPSAIPFLKAKRPKSFATPRALRNQNKKINYSKRFIDHLKSFAVDVDDVNTGIVFKIFSQLGDEHIHAACSEIIIITPDHL